MEARLVTACGEVAVVFGVMTAPVEGGPPKGRRILSSPPAHSESWEEKKKQTEISVTLFPLGFPLILYPWSAKACVFPFPISFSNPFQKPWGRSVISEKCMSLQAVSEKRGAFYSPHKHRTISSEEQRKLPVRDSFAIFPEKKKTTTVLIWQLFCMVIFQPITHEVH